MDIELLRSSFELVMDRQPDLTMRFYDLLFARHPEAQALFHRRSRGVQEKMLAAALVAVLDNLEDATWLQITLGNLGAKHVEYGVTDEMYGWVGECLLATLARAAGPQWTAEMERAWTVAFGAIADAMLAGAAQSRLETGRLSSVGAAPSETLPTSSHSTARTA